VVFAGRLAVTGDSGRLLRPGALFFQLRANPTKKIIDTNKPKAVAPTGASPQQECPPHSLRQPAELVAWLERKAATGGFAVEPDSLRVVPEGQEHFNEAMSMAHTPASSSRHAARHRSGGLSPNLPNRPGSGKAFGFGLLVNCAAKVR